MSGLACAFPAAGELPEAGWPRAAESVHPSLRREHPRPCHRLQQLCASRTCAASLGVQSGTRCFVLSGQKAFLALKLGSVEYGERDFPLK